MATTLPPRFVNALRSRRYAAAMAALARPGAPSLDVVLQRVRGYCRWHGLDPAAAKAAWDAHQAGLPHDQRAARRWYHGFIQAVGRPPPD